MKRKIFMFVMIAAMMYISGCKEEGRLDHIDDSAPAPAPVTLEKVTNNPGGAVIKYSIPIDKNLLGVKVVYTRNGEICESKASKYTDTLVVEGFGSTAPQEVLLYSVGVNEKLSEPVTVSINPLVPPVQTVTFDIEEGFGGVIVSLEENHSNANLALVLLSDTLFTSGEKRQWIQMQTFHTESAARKFSRRGLAPKAMDFAVYVRDRWGNTSDTVYRTLTPLEEIKLPKTEFRNAALPTDWFSSAEGSNNYRMENLWNGVEATNSAIYASAFSSPMPQWVTIDLGHRMSISRIQKWPRANYELYSGSGPRTFELWGSDNPNPDGSWESWHLLGEFEQFKPSGYGEGREVGPITDEDRDYWYNRTEFELTPTDNAQDPYMTVTHLRLKFTSSYTTYGTEATQGQIIVAEFTFWGQLKD
ncbi:MAG: DUF4959 domain-containing protein [Prevotellaceae bacterium]|jgi:hypothetical protein|nr:DUF4959 domain-containing protein [Prevotellaceae bacterium]